MGTGWPCSAAGSVVTCTNAGPVANGVTMSAITVTVTVGSTAVPSVTNSASVSAPTFDHTASNNSSSITTNVMWVNLQKSVSPSGSPQPPGTNLVYTVAFTNSGGAAARQVVITNKNPAAPAFKLNSPSPTAPARGTINVDYCVTIPPTAP